MIELKMPKAFSYKLFFIPLSSLNECFAARIHTGCVITIHKIFFLVWEKVFVITFYKSFADLRKLFKSFLNKTSELPNFFKIFLRSRKVFRKFDQKFGKVLLQCCRIFLNLQSFKTFLNFFHNLWKLFIIFFTTSQNFFVNCLWKFLTKFFAILCETFAKLCEKVGTFSATFCNFLAPKLVTFLPPDRPRFYPRSTPDSPLQTPEFYPRSTPPDPWIRPSRTLNSTPNSPLQTLHFPLPQRGKSSTFWRPHPPRNSHRGKHEMGRPEASGPKDKRLTSAWKRLVTFLSLFRDSPKITYISREPGPGSILGLPGPGPGPPRTPPDPPSRTPPDPPSRTSISSPPDPPFLTRFWGCSGASENSPGESSKNVKKVGSFAAPKHGK